MYQCIPGLGGRELLRGARAGGGPVGAARGGGGDGAHARVDALGFTCVVEERTKATGPNVTKAAELYGAHVVDRLLTMQHDTPWLVHDVVVPRGVLAAAGAAAARLRLEEEERLAEIGELSKRMDERPGTAAASELLSRVGSALGRSNDGTNDGRLDDENDDGLDNDDPNLVPGGGYGANAAAPRRAPRRLGRRRARAGEERRRTSLRV